MAGGTITYGVKFNIDKSGLDSLQKQLNSLATIN